MTPCRSDAVLPLKGVIFDCAGTLVDREERLHLKTLGQPSGGLRLAPDLLAQLKAVRNKHSCVRRFHCEQHRAACSIRFGSHGARNDAESFRGPVGPMSGARRVVEEDLACLLYVTTQSPPLKAELALSVARLLPLFNWRLYDAVEAGEFKPCSRHYLLAALPSCRRCLRSSRSAVERYRWPAQRDSKPHPEIRP